MKTKAKAGQMSACLLRVIQEGNLSIVQYKIGVQEKGVGVKYSSRQTPEIGLQEVCGNLQLRIARLRSKRS